MFFDRRPRTVLVEMMKAAYYPVDPCGQADSLAIHARTESLHALSKKVNILVYGRLLGFECAPAKGR